MWNLENGTDEPVCRAEIETEMQRKNVWAPRGKAEWGGGGDVINQEIGIDMYTLMCVKWLTNKKKRIFFNNKIK